MQEAYSGAEMKHVERAGKGGILVRFLQNSRTNMILTHEIFILGN